MPRRQWLFIVIMASIIVGISIAERLSPPATPPSYSESGKKTETKTASKRDQETIWDRFAADPVALATLAVALATGILAASTLGLWRLTRRSVIVAEQSLTVLERAYVFPSVVDFDWISSRFQFRIRLRSLGRTPAIIKEVAIKFNGNQPLIGIPDISGAVSQFFDWAINDTEFTDFFELEENGEQYFFGFVRYLDIFGKEHHSWLGVHFNPMRTPPTIRAGDDAYNEWD
jgi:hypothetical protein